jgi:hypothetical protein
MYQIDVLVNGYAIPVYHNFRDGTNWIEAREGNKFEIRVKNNSHNRILSIISVDGLNVINGKHEDPDKSPGYVLPPHDSIKIPGWKIDKEKVREFYFTNKESSYSKKLGANEENIGVIAVAIFKEKYYYTYTSYNPWGWKWNDPYIYPAIPNHTPQWITTTGITTGTGSQYSGSVITYSSNNLTSGSSNSANFVASSTPSNYNPIQVGVGSGNKTDFNTQTTYFGDKELETILTLYYDTRQGLLNRGINLDVRSSLPKPFPNGDYCPDI